MKAIENGKADAEVQMIQVAFCVQTDDESSWSKPRHPVTQGAVVADFIRKAECTKQRNSNRFRPLVLEDLTAQKNDVFVKPVGEMSIPVVPKSHFERFHDHQSVDVPQSPVIAHIPTVSPKFMSAQFM